MKRLIFTFTLGLLALATPFITGCATSAEYTAYVEGQKALAQARSQAEVARYTALAQIAETGDTAARVAAVISLQAGPAAVPAPGLQMPANTTALQWASVLVPGLMQMYTAHQSTRLGMRQSDNAAATAGSTNATMVGLGGLIQAPGASTSTVTTFTGSFNADSTHAPTVVTQPAPVIVQQPTPIVVRQPEPMVVRPEVVLVPAAPGP
jgi:hypothetical protein